jgi:hypothetical protein
MATVVQANLMGENGIQLFNFKNIGQKLNQLKHLCADTGSLLFMFVGMKVLFNMQDATGGGPDDIIKTRKVVYEKFIAFFRKMFKTRIGHRLAATSLVYGIHNVDTGFL